VPLLPKVFFWNKWGKKTAEKLANWGYVAVKGKERKTVFI